MDTKIVTCLYHPASAEANPFNLHLERARLDRYVYSLAQICQLEVPIVCYTDSISSGLLIELKKKNSLSNLEIKTLDLIKAKHSKAIQEIKKKHSLQFNFYHEIDWAKIDFLERELFLDPTIDYLYWMDSGLSHPGLFPNRYNPNRDKVTGMSANPYGYTFDLIFNKDLPQSLNKWASNKLINIGNSLIFHNTNDINSTLNKSHAYSHLTIGGIIGGNAQSLPSFFERFEACAQLCIEKEFILNHEAIMSSMFMDDLESYKNFCFSTWYHDEPDSSLIGQITPEYLSQHTSFYEFFKEIGQCPA
tara:strand:+ start:5626 stop:6537 length:912 start_codon:yes stop_codon:yes gene_type:complete